MSNMQKVGRVYKMYFRDAPEDLYVGSTSQTLAIRMQNHKRKARYVLYEKSKWLEHLRTQDLTLLRIELLEEVKYNNKQELLLAEDRYIRELKPKFNERRAHTTNEERKLYQKSYDAKPENRLKHKMINQKNISDKRYECVTCGYCFKDVYGLKNHFNRKIHKNTVTLQAINELQQLTEQNLFDN